MALSNYKHEGLKRYTGEYKDRHLVQPGDVIVTNTEQGHEHLLIGYPAIVPKCYGELGLFTHHLFRLRPLSDTALTSNFVYMLLRTRRMHEIVAGYTNGTTVNMLPLDGLQKPEIIVPSSDIVTEFDHHIQPLFDRAEPLFDENEDLACSRDALLPRLLSGEIRLSS